VSTAYKLTVQQRVWLNVVHAYEERYGKPCWAGREGTTEHGLEQLVEMGLLTRVTDEHRTRWWYRLTVEGAQALD